MRVALAPRVLVITVADRLTPLAPPFRARRNCPKCKKARTASKSLTLSRLPPVLLIHLKRFSTKNGVFWDKAETLVGQSEGVCPVARRTQTLTFRPDRQSSRSSTSI